jgi:beta-phosphoglucomutase-like phosphatase (HAD superfamily)
VALALRALAIESFFQAIATGDEVARGKPAPDVYLLAAARLGVPPARCLALEDAPLGVAAARAAGMVCVAVPNPRVVLRHFSEAHRIFLSLEDVRVALDDLLSG